MFQLFDPKSGKRIPLAGVVKTIGRVTDCDICFPGDTKMSRQHAELQWDGKQWFIEDKNSKNGTTVNGKSIKRCALHPGDFIELGLTELRYLPLESGSLFSKDCPSDTLPIPIMPGTAQEQVEDFEKSANFDVPTETNYRPKK
jgi:pSer/pThr/pTyr-binding forkhead associated (FHA) protein